MCHTSSMCERKNQMSEQKLGQQLDLNHPPRNNTLYVKPIISLKIHDIIHDKVCKTIKYCTEQKVYGILNIAYFIACK